MSLLERLNTPLHHEQVRALYQQSPYLFLGILMVMAVVTVFFWGRVETSWLLAWLAANLVLTLARALLVKAFHRRQPQGIALIKWGLMFTVSATLSGCLWSLISIVFMDLDDIESVFLVSIVLTGMTSGSQVALSTFLPAYFGFGLPALLPLAFILLSQGGGVLVLIGYLVVAFILVNIGFSIMINRNVSDSIKLRFENLDLLEDLKRQKEIAEKASTDKSRFLAATSHDLRQPLHAMDLYLGALETLMNTPQQLELLNKSQRSSSALKELLTSLMDISRLDAGEIVINRGPLSLTELVEDIYNEFYEQAVQRGIELALDTQALVVDSDATMLGRILRNLLNNACTHSKASRISITAKKQEEQVRLSVCDNGCGIPEDSREQIFSEFYQLNNPERDRNKGLGLGLAIVQRLARLLQHRLHLESPDEGGSCFNLYLPLVDTEPPPLETGGTGRQLDISGLFIILVDDEEDIRNAMRSLLLQWGCELLIADSLASLQQELAVLDYSAPDVLLCDYRLRENRSGLDVVTAMRAHFGANIPALIISGDTDRKLAEKAARLGCEMLHKPVQPEQLRMRIYASVQPG